MIEGGGAVKKKIVFVMYTKIIGQGLYKNFTGNGEYDAVLTSDYKDTELYLGGKAPQIVVVEVPDHSLYPLSHCLEVCKRFKSNYPHCKCMLFLSYTYLDNILYEVVEAKRDGKIDGFTTANTRVEEVVAAIKALA